MDITISMKKSSTEMNDSFQLLSLEVALDDKQSFKFWSELAEIFGLYRSEICSILL